MPTIICLFIGCFVLSLVASMPKSPVICHNYGYLFVILIINMPQMKYKNVSM